MGSTAPLAHDVSAETFASAIRALGSSSDDDVGETVTVSRSRTGVRGYAWTVTFEDLEAGDRPQLVVVANASLETRAADGVFALDVETVTDGVEAIGGTFELTYLDDQNDETVAYSSGTLSYDASAREVSA